MAECNAMQHPSLPSVQVSFLKVVYFLVTGGAICHKSFTSISLFNCSTKPHDNTPAQTYSNTFKHAQTYSISTIQFKQ